MEGTIATARDRARLAIPALPIVGIGVTFALFQILGPNSYAQDFDVYRAAGRAVLRHEALFGPWISQQTHNPLPFTYPPVAALFTVPFVALGDAIGYLIWDALSIFVLVLVVRAVTRPLLARFSRPGVVLAIAVLFSLSLTPVQDELMFGQVGIVLMAMCLFDCLNAETRLPRGMLVGAAAAIKLVPAVFIPYLWFSGRRQAAMVATATSAALTLFGAAVLPHDSKVFWTSSLFDNNRVGDNAYMSNQALDGMIRRAFGSHAQLLWFVLAVGIAIYGLQRAALASRNGRELLGICLTALVGIEVSPVSWIHHMVWIVPVLALLLGDGRSRRRVLAVFVVAIIFTLRVPYYGDNFPRHSPLGLFAGIMTDAYGIIALGLIFVLGEACRRRQPVDVLV